MLGKNLKRLRESKNLSQQQLADSLHVVRQTVSKWEKDLSEPNAQMLVSISRILEVPITELLEVPQESEAQIGNPEILQAKIENLEAELLQTKERRKKYFNLFLISAALITVLILIVLAQMQSSYLLWNLSDPETAVAATFLHGFEWLFVRAAPFILITAAGLLLFSCKKSTVKHS